MVLSFKKRTRKTPTKPLNKELSLLYLFSLRLKAQRKKKQKRNAVFRGVAPYPTLFFEKKRGKKLSSRVSASLTIKSKTVGTDEASDGFLPRPNYTSVESEISYSIFIYPSGSSFGSFLSRKEQKNTKRRTPDEGSPLVSLRKTIHLSCVY